MQLACRHAPAALWNALEVQTQLRSVKLVQPPAAAAWVEHEMMHSDWALTARAAAATKKSDLKSMVGEYSLHVGNKQVLHLKCIRGKCQSSWHLLALSMISMPGIVLGDAWHPVQEMVPKHRTFQHTSYENRDMTP